MMEIINSINRIKTPELYKPSYIYVHCTVTSGPFFSNFLFITSPNWLSHCFCFQYILQPYDSHYTWNCNSVTSSISRSFVSDLSIILPIMSTEFRRSPQYVTLSITFPDINSTTSASLISSNLWSSFLNLHFGHFKQNSAKTGFTHGHWFMHDCEVSKIAEIIRSKSSILSYLGADDSSQYFISTLFRSNKKW